MEFPFKRHENHNDIVILPPDKGHVIVVMDKTDYNHKMDTLVNDEHTYELLIQDPTPSLERKLNSKIFSMTKANMINLLPTQIFSSTTTKTLRTT